MNFVLYQGWVSDLEASALFFISYIESMFEISLAKISLEQSI